MFSFHKPRVYRSTEGCCICRAKSSSSRFTDSKKYEDDSMKCFNLEKPRQGEICNACVLLVKRFKRLPIGSNRHWGHVVDARIGPGMKSISKFKKLKEECQQQQRQNSIDKTISSKLSSVSEKFCKIFRKNKKKRLDDTKFIKKRDVNSSDENSSPATPESLNSDEEGIYRARRRRLSGIRRRKGKKPTKLSKKKLEDVGFFDQNDWVPRWLCCGVIYENSKIGALLIDHEKYKPCPEHVDFFRSTLVKKQQPFANETSDKTERVSNPHAFKNRLNAHQNALLRPSLIDEHGESMLTAATSIINKNHFALKKHHIYYKRQSEIFPQNDCTPMSIDGLQHKISSGVIALTPQQSYHPGPEITLTPTPKVKQPSMQKTKSDTSKLVKNGLDKPPPKVKSVEVMETKDTQMIVASATSIVNPSGAQTAAVGNGGDAATANKFSDNSSDSGFDENLPDPSQLHAQPHDMRERKIIIRPIESLFLSSTVPITLPAPPGSLKPTIQSHKTIHTPHSIALLNNRKIRAIYNATADGGLTRVNLPSSAPEIKSPDILSTTPSSTTMGSSSITHKKFLYVKGKQNVEATNN